MNYALLIPLLLFLPFASFLLCGLLLKNSHKLSAYVATIILLATTLLSLAVANDYFFHSGATNGTYQPILAINLEWLHFPGTSLSIDAALLLDPISVMMLVVISLVSLMVHWFSIGYMSHEKRVPVYFAFLGLFTFSMIGLVLSGNIFQMYIFWELVGVSSYLLIGFYYTKASAVAAAKKAFIVTRFADFGFLIGILLLGANGGSFDFLTLIQNLTAPQSEAHLAMTGAGFMGISVLTWALVLVFIGGAGKSAMFPLHIWLPDAMEGPTPVSALIHAATMVVAGVFLVARLFPIFAINHAAREVVTFIGLFSAVFAACIAIVQTDIKRVLAYSTMSQIGYMMFSLGIAKDTDAGSLGFTASMFHLFTHAFFKSLLFLGAGVIIHAVHSNEVTSMGGLRKNLPVTHACFLIACLAIAGIPPLSGFFSKEEILLAAFQQNKLVYVVALLTAGLTAFYMFRLYFLIFWNKPVVAQSEHSHHEPVSMTMPLLILAILTVVTGFIPFGEFISANGKPFETELHVMFSLLPVAVVLLGIGLAYWLYAKTNERPAQWANSMSGPYATLRNKFYIDEVYLFITKRIIFPLIGKPAAWADKHVVNEIINQTGEAAQSTAGTLRPWQGGRVQWYAIWFFAGSIAVVFLLIYAFN